MSDDESSNTDTPKNNQPNFPTDFAAQFAEFMRFTLNASGQNPKTPSNQPESLGDVTVTTKLNGENYPLWAKLMRKAIGGKGLTSHIIGVSDPPPTNDPNYPRWEQRDHCIFNWIINNIEIDLVNEISQYETAIDLWEGLAITYGSGRDPFQVYDLHRQCMTIKQGEMSLEALWNKFQVLWISIDARDPSTIDHPPSVEKDNRKTQRMRVYQFLTALDERFEAIKKAIINKDPLPTPREVYAMVRREAGNERILKPTGKKGAAGLWNRSWADRLRPKQDEPASTSISILVQVSSYLRQSQRRRRQKSIGV